MESRFTIPMFISRHSPHPIKSDMTPKIHHNYFQDCDVCEECVKTPNHHFRTCLTTGTKCRRDTDCKEEQKCLRSLSVNVEGKRCYAAPFNCKGWYFYDVYIGRGGRGFNKSICSLMYVVRDHP